MLAVKNLRSRLPPHTLLAACAALIFGLHALVVVNTVVEPVPRIWSLHNDTIHRKGRAVDFYSIYHAAILVQQGLTPYGEPTVPPTDLVTPYFYPFRYLPIVATVAAPLTSITPSAAYHGWVVVLEGLLLTMLWFLWRAMQNKKLWLFCASALLLSSPYMLELYVGQFTFAATVFSALFLLSPRLGMVTFPLAALLKPFPMVIAPALVRARRYWGPLLLAGLLMVLLSAPYFQANPNDFEAFVSANFRPSMLGLHAGNYGLPYVLCLLARDLELTSLVANWENVYAGARWLLLALTATFVLLSGAKRPVLGSCTLLLSHFVSYLHVWEHHLSAIILIAAVLMVNHEARRRDTVLIALSMLALALPTPFTLFDVRKNPADFNPADTWPWFASYVVALPKVVPTVALFLLSLRALMRDYRADGVSGVADERKEPDLRPEAGPLRAERCSTSAL
jgi:hypothetical protein